MILQTKRPGQNKQSNHQKTNHHIFQKGCNVQHIFCYIFTINNVHKTLNLYILTKHEDLPFHFNINHLIQKIMKKILLQMMFYASAVFFLTGIPVLNAQNIPLVYDVENTGAGLPKPVMPTFENLPVIEQLPDPFMWTDGSGRDITFEAWGRHRAEFKAMFEQYEIGKKPDRPEDITATFSEDSILTVVITVNGESLTLTSKVILPEGDGPFPAVIGVGSGSGSIPSNIFTTRNIAQIPFNFGQVMAHQQNRGEEPINKLYPELTYMGAYSAWSWGISRLIDGIEIVLSDKIDKKHLAVTGCSFAGKMALFAGAFDERIALTIAQESGGGGYTSWRFSETLGAVETLGATDYHWFIEDMRKFSGTNVPKLPIDHHQLMAMVAPRALLVTGNPDYEWLADPSGYVASRATQKIYETLGIPDRFGFSIVAGHGHCAVPASQIPEIGAFVDKFLLGNKEANTAIATHPYDYIDYARWFKWWGTDDSSLPPPDLSVYDYTYMEAECAAVGNNWKIVNDEDKASEKGYVESPETESLQNASPDSDNHIYFDFTIKKDATYYVYARLHCLTADDDSYYVKMDNGSWTMLNGLSTGDAWIWKRLKDYPLTSGEHRFILANRENGARVDKLCITDSPYTPEEMGGDAMNCDPSGSEFISADGYSLEQNSPNPFDKQTNISFEIPTDSYVSLKIYNTSGVEITELAGKNYPQGRHIIPFDNENLSKGIYFYIFKAGDFAASKKMIKK
jgi:hypothetical protein